MKHVLLKIYGAFSPANETARLAVETAGSAALSLEEQPWLFLEGDLLRISWEGISFPLEEVLDALTSTLPAESKGKLDVLDLESWTLRRHLLGPGQGQARFSASERSLNHVLDYAGH